MKLKYIFASLPFLTFACGPMSKQRSPQQSDQQTASFSEAYPGIVEVKRGEPVWDGIEKRPLIEEEQSHRVENERYQCRLLKLHNNVMLSYGTVSITCISLNSPESSGIEADSADLFIKDLGKFNGQITCRDRCLIKTETPVKDFKMKLNGKFVVELVEKKEPVKSLTGLVYPGVQEFRSGDPTTWQDFNPQHGTIGLRVTGPGREKHWRTDGLEIGEETTITWKTFSMFGNSLSGAYTSHIDADNTDIVAKDISQYWGKITCRDKCLIRTETPVDKFHMTLFGNFIVELIDSV